LLLRSFGFGFPQLHFFRTNLFWTWPTHSAFRTFAPPSPPPFSLSFPLRPSLFFLNSVPLKRRQTHLGLAFFLPPLASSPGVILRFLILVHTLTLATLCVFLPTISRSTLRVLNGLGKPFSSGTTLEVSCLSRHLNDHRSPSTSYGFSPLARDRRPWPVCSRVLSPYLQHQLSPDPSGPPILFFFFACSLPCPFHSISSELFLP